MRALKSKQKHKQTFNKSVFNYDFLQFAKPCWFWSSEKNELVYVPADCEVCGKVLNHFH